MKFNLNNFKANILLGVICSLLIIGVGYSFAFFVAEIDLDNKLDTGKLSKASQLLKVKYNAGSSAINMTNAYPGISESKTFTVTVTPGTIDKSVKYFIHFNITANNFVACSNANKDSTNNCAIGAKELTYTLTGVDDAKKTILNETGDLTNGVTTIPAFQVTQTTSGEAASTYTYTLTISFNDTNSDQNHNRNKSLSGSISVQYD